MQESSYRLEELLPHREPMILIDEVVSYDIEAKSLVAAVTINQRWCENWVAIEFMAQTAAALAGLFDRLQNESGAARPGFLLGTRKLTLGLERFEVGRRYLITARNEFADAEAASFSCEIKDGDTVVASATLNAFRPTDIEGFMKAQRES